jgi:Protein of unknown function (DUF2934)
MEQGKRTPSAAEIERRAYEIYEQRGRREGQAMSDWLAAERELRQSTGDYSLSEQITQSARTAAAGRR